MMGVAFRRSLHMCAAVTWMLTGVAMDGSPASSKLTCSRLWLSVVLAMWICSMAAGNRFRNLGPPSAERSLEHLAFRGTQTRF